VSRRKMGDREESVSPGPEEDKKEMRILLSGGETNGPNPVLSGGRKSKGFSTEGAKRGKQRDQWG